MRLGNGSLIFSKNKCLSFYGINGYQWLHVSSAMFWLPALPAPCGVQWRLAKRIVAASQTIH
jgi:hypothetical protein